MPHPPPGRDIRDATRGEGAPARRCIEKSRLTGAPTRRLKVSIPRFFSPLGRSGRSAGGVGQETPGTGGSVSRRRSSLAGPDRRGRRSLPTRPRRSRQRPLAGRDGGSMRERGRGVDENAADFSGIMYQTHQARSRAVHRGLSPCRRQSTAVGGVRTPLAAENAARWRSWRFFIRSAARQLTRGASYQKQTLRLLCSAGLASGHLEQCRYRRAVGQQMVRPTQLTPWFNAARRRLPGVFGRLSSPQTHFAWGFALRSARGRRPECRGGPPGACCRPGS